MPAKGVSVRKSALAKLDKRIDTAQRRVSKAQAALDDATEQLSDLLTQASWVGIEPSEPWPVLVDPLEGSHLFVDDDPSPSPTVEDTPPAVGETAGSYDI